MERKPWELSDDRIAEIEHDAHDVCSRCEGEGRLWADGKAHHPLEYLPTKACPECGGDGRVLSGNEGRDVATEAQKHLWQYIKQEWPKSSDYAEECNVCVDESLEEQLNTALGAQQ